MTTSSGEVQTSVALFDGATFVTSFDSDTLPIVDNSTYPVSRSMRFNVDRDSYINGTQPSMYYGSDQTMWVGFYDQMRPVVHTPLNGIPATRQSTRPGSTSTSPRAASSATGRPPCWRT